MKLWVSIIHHFVHNVAAMLITYSILTPLFPFIAIFSALSFISVYIITIYLINKFIIQNPKHKKIFTISYLSIMLAAYAYSFTGLGIINMYPHKNNESMVDKLLKQQTKTIDEINNE